MKKVLLTLCFGGFLLLSIVGKTGAQSSRVAAGPLAELTRRVERLELFLPAMDEAIQELKLNVNAVVDTLTENFNLAINRVWNDLGDDIDQLRQRVGGVEARIGTLEGGRGSLGVYTSSRAYAENVLPSWFAPWQPFTIATDCDPGAQVVSGGHLQDVDWSVITWRMELVYAGIPKTLSTFPHKRDDGTTGWTVILEWIPYYSSQVAETDAEFWASVVPIPVTVYALCADTAIPSHTE